MLCLAEEHNAEKYTEYEFKKIEIDIPSKKIVLSYPDYNKSFYRIDNISHGEIQGTWNGYYYAIHYYGGIKLKLGENNKNFEGYWMDKEKSYKLLWIAIEE
ncbi:MAG: hypothetical protein HUU50_11590 [Candidatus Brocadiae bacterium]|nr:hypothetical protein [Candidatus Brocadiia bacterium]